VSREFAHISDVSRIVLLRLRWRVTAQACSCVVLALTTHPPRWFVVAFVLSVSSRRYNYNGVVRVRRVAFGFSLCNQSAIF